MAKPYVEQHQLDQGHRPEDRQAGRLRSRPRTSRPTPARCHADAGRADQDDVPGRVGRQQFLAGRLQPEDQAALHPGARRLHRGDARPELPQQGRRLDGRRFTQRSSASKPTSRRRSAHRRGQERKVRIPYPNDSGALATAGGLVFTGCTDGTFVAYDDATLEELWKINVGTGFNAPPMTFEVNGKQYIAILAGLSPIPSGRHSHTPELRSCAIRPCCSCSGCDTATVSRPRKRATQLRAARRILTYSRCPAPIRSGRAPTRIKLRGETTMNKSIRTLSARRLRRRASHRPGVRRRRDLRAARQSRQGAAQLADAPSQL